ncbi:methionine biosynthesis protein MetW [Helicobacter typhlonius]|uniref:methionine biosynthesis protein MetW n=1 Tax=Helicobacter typhlonius TaxID=76936 RepID=UPI002FE180D5
MNDYFQARGVNPQMYKNTKLPAYFKEVIESLPSQSKVLDFGCGFGQNLLALKEKKF